MSKISIVIAYQYDKEKLIKALDIFDEKYSKYKFEVVIIEFNSKDKFTRDDMNSFNFEINYFQIINKECINIGMAYNIGFKKATGDIIIFQNSECIHIGNILEFTLRNLKPQYYFNFNCYEINYIDNIIKSNKQGLNYIKRNFVPKNDNLHFCNAIYKSKLYEIGGFDIKFKNGYSSEQKQLYIIIKNILRLKIINVSTNYVCCINSPINLDYDKQLLKKNHNILLNFYIKNRRLVNNQITLNEWQQSEHYNNISQCNDEYIKDLNQKLEKLKNDINIYGKEKNKLNSINILEQAIKDLQHKEIINTEILNKLMKEKEEFEIKKISGLEKSVLKLSQQKSDFLKKFPNIEEIPVLEGKYKKQLEKLKFTQDVQTKQIESLKHELYNEGVLGALPEGVLPVTAPPQEGGFTPAFVAAHNGHEAALRVLVEGGGGGGPARARGRRLVNVGGRAA
jgi:hypothetical protein